MDNLVHAKQEPMNHNALLNRTVFIQLSDSSEKSYYPDAVPPYDGLGVAVFIYIPGDTL
jgi:hypothetical protein